MAKKKVKRDRLQNLKSHREAYVTIGELAEYWLISRKQIYKQIEAGTLPAIRLGDREVMQVDEPIQLRIHIALDRSASIVPLREGSV